MIASAGFSETGPRSENQDRLLLPLQIEGSSCLAAIADGVGGASGGAVAAQIAVETVQTLVSQGRSLQSAFRGVKQALEGEGKLSGHSSMATTLSAVLISKSVCSVAHVGDTRVYHLRNRGIMDITEDQTEVAELLRRGVLKKHQADSYPRRNVLTSALSAAPEEEYRIYETSVMLEAGDRIVLISDGVYNQVRRRELAELSQGISVESFIARLKLAVEASGPKDNFSALALQFSP